MIKLALIGCGKWGRNYLRTLTSIEGCELKWVCDLDLQKLKEAVSAYPQIKFTENKSDIMNDSEVQGVIIATAPESHYMLAKEAMSKGKSVLVEKPVTIAMGDSIDLVRMAAQQNTILMAGYTLLYHPAVSEIKKILEGSSNIGSLCNLSMARTNITPKASGVDVLYDLAVHDIYLSCYLIGENPIWVTAHRGSPEESSNSKAIYIRMGFTDYKIASIFASPDHTEKIRMLTMVSTKAKLVFDDIQPGDKKIQLAINGNENYVSLAEENPEPLKRECIHFIECISLSKEPRSGRRDISSVAKITECISESLAKGGEKVFVC